MLAAAEAGLRTVPKVALSTARFQAQCVDKLFASTDGALCEQRLTECGGGLAVVAVDGDESQIRSYPASHGGHVAQGGYEHFLALDLGGHAPRLAEEAAALLSAPACPAGRTTLILAGEQLGLQIHESIGHAVELDRVLGREASYAGTSFVAADAIGSLRYGSEHVSVSADATNAGGLGSFRWDDEGVEGRAVPIVREGVLAGFLSSRETAAEIGLERSGGCMRADGFARQPIVRMTNVNLEPGAAGSLADLIAGTESGAALGDQPLLVDRQPPAAVPVRLRGRARDPRRRARRAVAQPELLRRHAAVLGELRRRLLGVRLAPGLPARLRQGRARAGDARVARIGAGALSRRGGGRGVNAPELAEAALAHARGEAIARVVRERSLMLRFAAGRPTQSTAVDDVTVELAVLREGHVGRASTNRSDPAGLADCARLATAAAEVAMTGGPGVHPGLDGAAAPAVPLENGYDACHRGARSRRRRGAARRGLRRPRAAAGLEAHGVWSLGAQEHAVAGREASRSERTTDAYMKVICIDPASGRSGYAARSAAAGGQLDGGALAARAAAKASAAE